MSGISLPRRQQLQVVITFLLLLALFNGISQIEQRYSGQYIDILYTSLVTTGAAYVGNLFMPFPIGTRGPVTLSAGDGVAVVVRGGCNGIEAVFLLLAGVLAFPVGWVNRARALLLYLPLLFFLNVLRVLMLLWVLESIPQHMDIFHYQIGQAIMVLFVMLLWIHFVRKSAPQLTGAD
jgi:exosortase/archaeosortase family protein